VLKDGKKIDIPGSKEKKKDFRNEDRTDHRGEYRGRMQKQKPGDTIDFSAVSKKKRRKK
jgi:hypothetical protein